MNRVKDVAFFQSITNAIKGSNQIVLDSALRSDTIITADQKFELVKLAIEKRSLPIVDYICYLKSATDISDEQTDKLIELIRKSSQNEDQELLYIIDRLQNINEKLDNKIQHNEAMKIISDLNKKNLLNTNLLLSLPGSKSLTESGTDFKPNHRSFEIEEYQESDYVMPLPVKDANPEQTPIKDGAFTKNPKTKGAKDGLLKTIETREHNLGGPVTKGLANFNTQQQNSILSRMSPAIPSRNNNGDEGEHIYEEINLSILKKPNEKDSSQVKITKIVTFDPALDESLIGKILPVKDETISDNTKGANQKNNDLATNNEPIDRYIAESDKNKLDLLNALSSTETPVNEQKNTVSANFKATQDAIKELFQPKQPNNKGTSPSKEPRPSFINVVNNYKTNSMPAESKTTPPPPPPMPDFLVVNQGNQKISTTLSKQQKTISLPNISSAKAGSQSKLEVTPEALSNTITGLKPAGERKSFINMVVHNNANNPQSNFTGNKQSSSANNTLQPPSLLLTAQALEAGRARLRKTGNDDTITRF